MNEKLLTAGEASKLLNIHRETLRRYQEKGYIKAIKTSGGHRRYKESEILAFKETLEAGLKHLNAGKPNKSNL